MRYVSTRNTNLSLAPAEAIAQGLSRDGGLFVPETLPHISAEEIASLGSMDYCGRAVSIMSKFLDGFSITEIADYTARAYGKNFDTPDIAPLRRLDEKTYFLELWHGPTCAFKDMALQVLPYLLTASMSKNGMKEKVCILVATSGDTGKAALEGFRDVEGTKIMVFYPENGVSDIQKLQMTSQEGGNVSVCAVRGNFDDAQAGVKQIFSDRALREELRENGFTLSSANSINWGRLLPQIVYYFSAYCDLLNNGSIIPGESVTFCVPTGNFGNILAGYYARLMGLPVNRLVCASNRNNVLTEFIKTGAYDRNRPFYTTISPSMDILVSSNLERLLYLLSGGSDAEVSQYMRELAAYGRYQVSEGLLEGISACFDAGFCDDAETKAVIRDTFQRSGILIDTHTAVALGVAQKLREELGDASTTVVVSTASPYKFCGSVLEALGKPVSGTGPELIFTLERETGVSAPAPLRALRSKVPRFNGSVGKEELMSQVRHFLL